MTSRRRELPVRFLHLAACAGFVLAAAPIGAQTVQNTTAHVVEWDLPAEADASPGAMVVDPKGWDKDRLFFVTRLGVPRVFRMNPNKKAMQGSAQWTSWELADDSFTTGGLRRLKASHDRRYLVVRTATSIQKIDTQNCSGGTCARAEYMDQAGSFNVSDLGIDDQNNIITAGFEDPGNPMSAQYIQRLPTGSIPADGGTATATVSRWTVGGGVGFCAELPGRTTTSLPCISGIFVSYPNRNLVYYSEPEGSDGMGAIAELNLSTNVVRRWALSAVAPPDPQAGAVQQPRQLIIDHKDTIWVITGSGHLVSLDTCSNKMRVHTIPMGMLSDPFGLAPDNDLVGYTDAGRNMVGMMFPDGPTFIVPPTSATVPKTTTTVTVLGQRATMTSGAVPPVGKVVAATITTKQDGVFVEAQLDSNGNDDMSPLGITANKGKGQGTFYYAVGFNGAGANRVGFVRLPKPKKVKHPRDDDDPEDGLSHQTHPAGWHINDNVAGDADGDGLDTTQDTTDREDIEVADDTPLNPGQSADYPMTASGSSLALVAVATADDPLAQLKVDIYNAMGLLVATSPVTPGVGVATLLLPAPGNYTVRVRNMGFTANTHTPMLITRVPWEP